MIKILPVDGLMVAVQAEVVAPEISKETGGTLLFGFGMNGNLMRSWFFNPETHTFPSYYLEKLYPKEVPYGPELVLGITALVILKGREEFFDTLRSYLSHDNKQYYDLAMERGAFAPYFRALRALRAEITNVQS